MNKHRKEYNERKDKVLNILDITKQYYEKYEKKHEAEMFKNVIETVKEDEFSIVLVGEFSAGKSTFFNALMGEKLLPSFTRETTATINYLRHKDRAQNGEEGRVYFSDGSVEVLDKVDFSTISKYVSTESNLNVVNKVEHVELFLDSKFLEGNITLVDSPGLNGVADGHREVTEKQIEKSSASIFMFKADQPGSDTDFKFIGELKDKVNTIIFALNKIDEIKVSEGETPESVIQSLKNIYKNKFPNENYIPEIWGIAAYPALVARSNQVLDYNGRNDYTKEEKKILEQKSKMNEFEDRLWQFITKGEKAKAMLLSPINKVVNLLATSRSKIEEELSLLNSKNDKSEIEEKILEVKKQLNEINNSINTIENQIEDNLNKLIEEYQESVESNLEALKEKQVSKLHNWQDIDELIQFESNIVNEVQDKYKKVIHKCEKDFIKGMKEIISENYSEVAKDINNSFRDVNFKILVDTKYEPNELDFKLGIEKYEEQIKQLEKELYSKEQEIEDIDVSIIKARKLEREKENIKKQILNAENQMENYINLIAPSKEISTEQVYEKTSRGGVLGFAVDIIVGKKDVPVTKTTILNEKEIEEFKELKKKKVSEYEEKLNNLNSKLDSININDESESYEYKKHKILEQSKKIKDSVRITQEEFKKKYLKQNEVALRNRKYELEKYFDEINEEYSDKLYEEFYNKKTIFFELIKSSIANSLNVKLQEKNDELIFLQNKLESSQEEKQMYIDKLTHMLEESGSILSDAIELEAEIESEPVDKIEEVLL